MRVKCEPDDTIGDLKKLIAAQTGTRPEKLKLQKWNIVYRDHITLAYVPSQTLLSFKAKSMGCVRSSRC